MTIERYSPRQTPYTEMHQTPDGEYVRHEDYATVKAHNDYLMARLRKQGEQLEAIGAGGVSRLAGCDRCNRLQAALQAVLDDKVNVLSRATYDQIREAMRTER